MPTKSGVIGLIAAALGQDRQSSLEAFENLGFGVRIDQPGTLLRDFQTARPFDGGKPMPLSERYYLQDAVFVAAVESPEREVLESFQSALRRPHYAPYLGRRSCPPAGPIDTWLVDVDIESALRNHPLQGRDVPTDVDAIIDAYPGSRPDELLNDEPVSFDPRHRRYRARGIRRITYAVSVASTPEVNDHDPTAIFSEGAP